MHYWLNSVNKVALTETNVTLEGYATVFAKNGYLFYFSTHGCQPKYPLIDAFLIEHRWKAFYLLSGIPLTDFCVSLFPILWKQLECVTKTGETAAAAEERAKSEINW